MLPEWADSLVQLGAALFRRSRATACLHVCITLPTSSMAAVLVATGASLASVVDSNRLDPSNQYERLCDLEPGTPIAILNQGKVRSGWIEGPAQVMGQSCIAYIERKAHGNERRYLFRDRALDIEPLPEGAVPFAVARTAFEAAHTARILESLRPGAAAQMAIEDEQASVVFTRLSEMDRDLAEKISFANSHPLSFLDLARPDRLLPYGAASRTQVVPSSADDESGIVYGEPSVAIFDGPRDTFDCATT